MSVNHRMNLYQDFWKCKSVEVPIFIRREPAQIFSPLHWHNATEIILMTSGEITASLRDQEYTVSAGELILFNSGELHSTRATCLNTCLMLTIPDEFWEHHVPGTQLPKFENWLTGKALAVCRDQLLKINDNYDVLLGGNSLPYFREIFAFLDMLYTNRLSSMTDDFSLLSPDQRQNLSLVKAYVEEHYAESISLETIARLVNLQPNYFCRYFKKITGSTFQNYLNEVRLQKIYDDLLRTSDPIRMITERHGFTNERVFRREFHALFNNTPSEIRRQSRIRS